MAHAGATEKVTFGAAATAHLVTLDSGHGWARIGVASNSAFTISVDGVVGEISTQFEPGRLGAKAQQPGPRQACATALGRPEVIYAATRRTAARRGPQHAQVAVFRIDYPSAATPAFTVDADAPEPHAPLTCDGPD